MTQQNPYGQAPPPPPPPANHFADPFVETIRRPAAQNSTAQNSTVQNPTVQYPTEVFDAVAPAPPPASLARDTLKHDAGTPLPASTGARYGWALALAVLSVATLAYPFSYYFSGLGPGIVAAVLVILAAVILPGHPVLRSAGALLAAVLVLLLSLYPFYLYSPWFPAAAALLSASWTVARGRHVLAVLGAAIIPALFMITPYPVMLTWSLLVDLNVLAGRSGMFSASVAQANMYTIVLVALILSAWLAHAIDLPFRRSRERQSTAQPFTGPGAPTASTAPTAPTGSAISAYALPQGSGQGTNGLAIAALITVFFAYILGLVLGYIALSQIKRTGQNGHGLALAAVVIGWISLVVSAIFSIWLFNYYQSQTRSLFFSPF